MGTFVRLRLPLALLLSFRVGASAQSAHIRGIAFDSVSMAPLAHALLTIPGSGRSVVADSRGHFDFDSVLPTRHVVRMQHERLDALGLASVTREVTAGVDSSFAFAVPSYRALWRRVCGEMPFDEDRGVIFGTLSSAARARGTSAGSVAAHWADVRIEEGKFSEQRWRSEAVVDSTGRYVLCGVPFDKSLRVEALAETRATDAATVVLDRSLPIVRKDFRIAYGNVPSIGTLLGQVVSVDGDPIRNVRVRLGGKSEVRTQEDGSFVFRDVPTGTRRVEALTLGSVPTATMVDVYPNDTAHVIVEMNTVRTLDSVRIVASALRLYRRREIDFRRQSTGGYFRDSTEVGKHVHLAEIFESIPSVQFANGQVLLPGRPGTGMCTANVWLDGALMDASDLPGELRQRNPADIAVIEVYPRILSTPGEFVHRDSNQSLCGSVVLWTKRALK